MRESVLEKIELLRKSLYANQEYRNFAHAITLSGLLIMKPQRFETKGKEMYGFILFQINKGYYECYRCQTFSKNVIEELLEQKNVCEVNCLGRLVRKGMEYLIQIEEIAISGEYVEIPLDQPYSKENTNE